MREVRPESQAERLRSGAPVAAFRGRFSKIGEVGRDVEPAQQIRMPARPSAGVVAVVYSAPWCPACREAKSLLASLGVRIDERDVDSDRGALAELKTLTGGQAAIPVTVLGDAVIAGYDPDRLRAAVSAAKGR